MTTMKISFLRSGGADSYYFYSSQNESAVILSFIIQFQDDGEKTISSRVA